MNFAQVFKSKFQQAESPTNAVDSLVEFGSSRIATQLRLLQDFAAEGRERSMSMQNSMTSSRFFFPDKATERDATAVWNQYNEIIVYSEGASNPEVSVSDDKVRPFDDLKDTKNRWKIQLCILGG